MAHSHDHSYLLIPLLQKLRERQALPYIHRGATLLDVGCGEGAELLRSLSTVVDQGFGIDSEVRTGDESNLHFLKHDFEHDSVLPWSSDTFDCVTMLAVLEHVNNRDTILHEVHRVLKSGGTLVLTAPSSAARVILNLLAWLHLVDPVSIAEHKIYFKKKELVALIQSAGFNIVKHAYFEWGFNHRIVAIR